MHTYLRLGESSSAYIGTRGPPGDNAFGPCNLSTKGQSFCPLCVGARLSTYECGRRNMTVADRYRCQARGSVRIGRILKWIWAPDGFATVLSGQAQ